jgi:hypothetical protein
MVRLACAARLVHAVQRVGHALHTASRRMQRCRLNVGPRLAQASR